MRDTKKNLMGKMSILLLYATKLSNWKQSSFSPKKMIKQCLVLERGI